MSGMQEGRKEGMTFLAGKYSGPGNQQELTASERSEHTSPLHFAVVGTV